MLNNTHSPIQQSPEALILKTHVKQKLQQYSYIKSKPAMDISAAAPVMASAVAPVDTLTSTAAVETPRQAGKRVRISNSPENPGAVASSSSAPPDNLPVIDISDIPDLTQEQMMREVTRNLRYLLADNKTIHSDLRDLKNAVDFQDEEIEKLKKTKR